MRQTVAVAMSGGVDSSVAAARLVEQGFQVFGLTALLTTEYSRCCAAEDIETAAQVARGLGIAHHVVDVRDAFLAAVIEPFMAGYTGGETPSPCVSCNREIKFGALMREARRLGADLLATGHYVRREERPDGTGPILRRGMDPRKDQSYFLARLTGEQLGGALFPVGCMEKRAVSQYAAEHNMACRRSRESQDVCFVTSGTHGDWIELRSFDTRGPGDMVDTSGRPVGRHLGIHHYTVGQRKGLGIALGAPAYVAAIDPVLNRVVVGPREACLADRLTASGMSWMDGAPPAEEFDTLAQVRFRHEPAPARVRVLDNGRINVHFESAQFAVAPGQLVALYDGDRVLGGGWIERRTREQGEGGGMAAS